MDEASARRRRHARTAGTVSVHELQARATPAEQATLSAIQARAAEEANALTAPLRIPAEEMRRAIAHRDAARAAVRPSGHAFVPPVRRVVEPPPVAALQFPPDGVGPVMPAAPTEDVWPESAETPSAGQREPDAAEPPRTQGRLATTIVATLAAMAVLGAITAVGATGVDLPRLSPGPPIMQPRLLEGPVVVRPDLIVAELTRASDPSAAAATPIEPLPSSGPAEPAGRLADIDEASRVVAAFYGDLSLRSDEAFQQLAPSMRGDGEQRFAAAWRGASVDSEIRGSADGAVRVAVSINRPGEGEVIRLVQRIEVRAMVVDGVERLLIADAQLLAAHRE